MKKCLLPIVLVFFILFNTKAQVCSPAWAGSGDGIRPDSAQNFSSATVDSPYSQTVQLKVPADTMYLGQSAAIDSIVLTQVTGLPSTITYACNPSNCSFPGGTVGCVQFSGIPVTGDIGVHHLKVKVLTYVFSGHLAVPDSIMYYSITVNATAGINTLNTLNFKAGQNYPNPVKGTTQIYFNLPVSGDVQFRVYNLLGTAMFTQDYISKSGANYITFDAGNIADGMYFYSLSDGITTITHRMIIDKR